MSLASQAPAFGYRPRRATEDLKEIVEDHLEELLRVYDDRFAAEYGPMHPRVRDLFERYGMPRHVCEVSCNATYSQPAN